MLWCVCLLILRAFGNCENSSGSKDDSLLVCDDTIVLGGHRYGRGTLIDTDNGLPADIALDWKTGNIFYSVNHGDKIRLYILRNGTEESAEITGIPTVGPTTTVDQNNGIVYIATNDGLFTYNDTTTSAVPFGAKGVNIAHAHMADGGRTIYYLTMNEGEVYKLPLNQSAESGMHNAELYDTVPDAVGFAVDGHNNFYYAKFNKQSLFKRGNSGGVDIPIRNNSYINHFYVDKHDIVSVVKYNSDVYEIDKISATPRYVGNLGYDFILDAAIDFDDSIIVGVYKGLKRLKKLDHDACVTNSTKTPV